MHVKSLLSSNIKSMTTKDLIGSVYLRLDWIKKWLRRCITVKRDIFILHKGQEFHYGGSSLHQRCFENLESLFSNVAGGALFLGQNSKWVFSGVFKNFQNTRKKPPLLRSSRSQMLLKICKIHRKTPVLKSLNKFAGLHFKGVLYKFTHNEKLLNQFPSNL